MAITVRHLLGLVFIVIIFTVYTFKNRQWDKEIESAAKKKRTPRLWNAVFRMFVPYFIVDGFECLAFILIRYI